MYVIWHDRITKYFIVVFGKKIKPFIYAVIKVCYFKQMQPIVICKSAEIRGSFLRMFYLNTHNLKIGMLHCITPSPFQVTRLGRKCFSLAFNVKVSSIQKLAANLEDYYVW